MERHHIDLDRTTFRLIMFPLCGINLFFNIFFGCCLISNRHKVRQPLKVLLTFLVWCTIAFAIHLLAAYPLLAEINGTDKRLHVMWMITMFITNSSMTTTVWMSFYYYLQIVPSQRAVLIWIKRNIKSFVYTLFLLDEIIIAFSASLKVASMIPECWAVSANNCTSSNPHAAGLTAAYTANLIFVNIHILFCMAIMGVCNFSMTHYLLRHIKSRTREGFAASGTQGQMRVAISESFQAVLFLICSGLYFADSFTFKYPETFSFSPSMSHTVALLYMTGTTASLATGQAIFRQGAVDVWKALTAPCCASV